MNWEANPQPQETYMLVYALRTLNADRNMLFMTIPRTSLAALGQLPVYDLRACQSAAGVLF